MHLPHFSRRKQSPHPLLWLSGALAAAIVVFALALGVGKALFPDAVALELAPATGAAPVQHALAANLPQADDPFYQRKRDAKQEELPTQF